MATEAQTTTAPAANEKETIPQKVEKLQAQKTALTSKANSMPEGNEKVAVHEEIAVIDRKLRWYAGRSEGNKASADKGKSRPTSASKRESKPKAPKAEAPAAQASTAAPVSTPANES